LTEEHVPEAAELERQAAAAYNAKLAALRTSDWVGDTSEPACSVTRPMQIQFSNANDERSECDSYFGGFSASMETLNKVVPWVGENTGGDLFETPPNKWSRPLPAPCDLPLNRPLIPSSFAAKMASRRNWRLSPCAYRDLKQAELLFNVLHHVVSTGEQS
jgi:hypothetical protein